MKYEVILKRSAEKELDRLSGSVCERVTRRLEELEENPRPMGIKKLTDEDSYRIRVGDYRVLYEIDDAAKKIQVFAVRHRREAYR